MSGSCRVLIEAVLPASGYSAICSSRYFAWEVPHMSSMDLESPDADAVEQHADVIPEDSDADEPAETHETPLEANQADSAEQDRILAVDDDEYR